MNTKTKALSIGACLVTMFCIGIVYLWSVFQQPVIDHYGWSSSAVTMVSSAIIFFYVLGTLIGGNILDRTSPSFVTVIGGVLLSIGLYLTSLLGPDIPWLIYITYGLCAGFGVGFAYGGALNCIQKWFPHKRGFATGISVCAFGLATVVLGPLIELFIAKLGVPGAFRAMAFSFPLIVIVMGLFIKNPTQEYLCSLDNPAACVVQRQYKPSEALRSLEFWSLALSLLFLPAAYMMIIPRIKTLGLLRGLTDNMATIAVSLTGVASAASRLIAGYVSDRIGGAKTIWILTAINLVSSVLLIFADGGLYIVAVLLIVCGYSGPAGIFPTLSTNAFGTKHSGTNYGLAFMFLGISSPLFTMISNMVSASGVVTGNYTAAFVIAAAGCVVPLVMLPLYDVARKKHRPIDDAMVEKDPSLAQ
ncbi:MAG: OFA family MFS transporter [Oscillospiraceae bacterium]|nr:OFA family MFS transporter [Oscillospiraceae bacterium]